MIYLDSGLTQPQKNPIETSYINVRGAMMIYSEVAREYDGLVMYYVVVNSSLCL